MQTSVPLPRLMRLSAVMRETGLSRPTIYRRVKLNEFPRPRAIGLKSSAWLGEEIEAWIASRPFSEIAAPAHEATT